MRHVLTSFSFFSSWLVFRAFICTSVSEQQADTVPNCVESPESIAYSRFLYDLRAPQSDRLLLHMKKSMT